MRAIRSDLLFSAAVFAVQCACSADPAARDLVVRDSAGVTIVESTAPAWREGDGWRIEAEPRVDIGRAQGDPRYEFDNIYDVMRLPDGRIFVGDQGNVQVKVFSADGEYLQSIGRAGRGPGEFGQVGTMFPFRGDSIVVYDYILQQMDVFDRDGGFGRAVPLRFSPEVISRIVLSGGSRANYWLTGIIDDSLFFLSSPGETSHRLETPGTYWDSTSFFLYQHPDSEVVDLGRFPLRELAGRHGSDYPMFQFGGRMVMTTTASGYLRGENHTLSFGEYDWDGTLRRVVRALTDPLPVTADVIEDFRTQSIDQMLHGSGERIPESELPRIRRLLDDAIYSEYLPVWDGMLADPEGNVWCRQYRFRYDADQSWTVFSTDGRWLGAVDMPPGLQVLRFGRDWVLGVVRDELDVEHVRVHRIIRS